MRAVLSNTLTQTNKFWTELVYSFRFGFPRENTIHEAINLDKATDRWGFTGLFLNHMLEIRAWNVEQDFFHNWPETYEDIVPALEIGQSLSLAPRATSLHELLWRAGDRFRDHYQNLLPLPVREGDSQGLNASDEEDNSSEGLFWRMPVSVSPAAITQSGFMPAVCIDS